MTSGPQWYVVHTQPHAETKAATHLTRQGYTIYLPRFVGVPVAKAFDDLPDSVDAVLVTDSRTTRATAAAAVERFGADRVLIPQLLARAIAKRGDVS